MAREITTDIKFARQTKVAEQRYGGVLRVVGFVKVKNIIPIIDTLNLDANPRASKTGAVTNSIQESLETTPTLFPFKTKGILLGASKYNKVDEGRYSVSFVDVDTEGVLDGGHNLLAIGLYVLKLACSHGGETLPKKISTWADFKQVWLNKREVISSYQADLRKGDENSEMTTVLDVLVPLEMLLPARPNDKSNVEEFQSNLLDICGARNNNVQLTAGTKADKQGDFEALKHLIEQRDSRLAQRIEWKTNDGGDIKVEDIIALAWIPLSLTGPYRDEFGKPVDPPSPVHIYSGKAQGLNKYVRLMGSDEVTTKPDGDYRRELKNSTVESALEIAAELPELYDYIYECFPEYYNDAGGRYGRITAVKSLNDKRKKNKTTPFGKRPVQTLSPDGFVAPLVYGLKALMIKQPDRLGNDRIEWRVEPHTWLVRNLESVVKKYSVVLAPSDYDPQKVGKYPGNYDRALDAYKMALAGIE